MTRLTTFVAYTALAASLAVAGACAQSTSEPGEDLSSAPCVSDYDCASGYECFPGGCSVIRDGLYPHIQTASALFREHLDDEEIEWRAAHHDLLIGRVLFNVDLMRGQNPNARLIEYINIRYNLYEDFGTSISAWAQTNGYDPEDFFLHYKEDTAVPTWEGIELAPGYPPGTVPGWNPNPQPGDGPASASAREESRALGFNVGQTEPFPLANIAHPGFRQFLTEHIAGILDGTGKGLNWIGPPLDGIVGDNAIYYPLFDEGKLGNTHEYEQYTLDDSHPYGFACATIYPETAAEIRDLIGYPVDFVPNFGNVSFLNYPSAFAQQTRDTTPWAWGEVWIYFTGTSSPVSGSNRTVTYDRDYANAISAVIHHTRNGGRRILGARDRAGGDLGTGHGKLFLLSLYYLVHNPNTYFLYESVNTHNGPNHLSTWTWFPAIQFDIGQPVQNDSGIADFDGRMGTREHYVFASGPDPINNSLTYRVLARRFSNALVLVKMLPEGSGVATNSATVHQLDGEYMPLAADGTLGAASDVVSIRNNQGVILIPVN